MNIFHSFSKMIIVLFSIIILHIDLFAKDLPGLPKLSDVVFCSRWARPIAAKDPNNTLDSIHAFHGTWVAWMYLTPYVNTDSIFAELSNRDIPVQGALSTIFQELIPSKTVDQNIYGFKLNVNQQPFDNVYAGCPASPIFQAWYRKNIDTLMKYKVNAVQADDWSLRHYAVPTSATSNPNKCYCNYCLEAFRNYLHTKPAQEVMQVGIQDIDSFDYRKFVLCLNWDPARIVQTLEKWYNESALKTFNQFWADTHEYIQSKAGWKIPVSANALTWNSIPATFDFAVAEFPNFHVNPEYIYKTVQTNLTTLNRRSIFTLLSPDVHLNRVMMALTTSSGGNLIVPWDVNLVNPNVRYYGKPSEYADLCALIRANAKYIDGYSALYATGNGIIDPKMPTTTLQMNSKSVSAFIRAKTPQASSDAYYVIHLVDSSTDPDGFIIRMAILPNLDPKKIRFNLCVPATYDAVAHETAEETKNFEPLVNRKVLPSKIDANYIYIAVPPLTPWGILAVTYS